MPDDARPERPTGDDARASDGGGEKSHSDSGKKERQRKPAPVEGRHRGRKRGSGVRHHRGPSEVAVPPKDVKIETAGALPDAGTQLGSRHPYRERARGPYEGKHIGATKLDAATLLMANAEPEFTATLIPEPELIFGGHQRLVDPKTGLALFGPFDARDPGRRTQIRVGVIGTGETIDLLRQWMDRCRGKVMPVRRTRVQGRVVSKPMDPMVFSAFPGITEVFGTTFDVGDGLDVVLRHRDIAELEGIKYFEPRVTRLVDMIVERLRVLADKPSPPDVVVCAMPTTVRDLCTVASRHRSRPSQPRTPEEKAAAALAEEQRLGQTALFDMAASLNLNVVVAPAATEHGGFHHALKARAMEVGIPTQLVWQSTLEGMGEDDATRAWNFWTGMYYKAGGVPWRVAGLARGTCFVGVSFYRDRGDGSYRTCMAQAFSDQGEGFVIRSEPFKWEELRSPHLTEGIAAELMTRVLVEYERHLQHPPSRVVVHKWSRYDADERRGFARAIESRNHDYDLVAFGTRDVRFFRTGVNPPLRGTLVTLGPGNALLYTLGYVPFTGVYAGMRVPRPIEITEHVGSSPLTQIAAEVMALTKLDWNSAAFAGKQPITTAFSDDVGDILAELPPHIAPKTQYRFYM